MERDKIESLLNSGNEPMSSDGRRKLLAEFDRLKLRVAALAADLWDAQAALDEEQNWLGTISEPMKGWEKEGRDYIIALLEQGGWYPQVKISRAIAAYLDSQEPSEKLYCNHWSIKDYSKKHSGKQVDCPICNLLKCKPQNQCPKCEGSGEQGIMPNLQNYSERWHGLDNVLWERIRKCPTCAGNGVVPRKCDDGS